MKQPDHGARSTLDLDAEEMRSLGYRIVDSLVSHYENLSDKPVSQIKSRETLDAILAEPPPEQGTSALELVERLEQDVFSNIMLTNHPRFFAFVPGPSNYVGAMADALASGYNAIVCDWAEASGPAAIEAITVDWLRSLCGFPAQAGGLFVSGGSLANLTALATARHIMLDDNIEGAMLYCSDQTHASNHKGLRLLGFNNRQIRAVPTDELGRMEVGSLVELIEQDRNTGQRPFCVIANAGTTNTGAVDPLVELSEICRAEGLWLHADGAYGAAAVISTRGKAALEGLGRVDSLSIDPHKWLFQPFEIGCVLVRDADLLRRTFTTEHEYMQDVDSDRQAAEINYCDYGIQLTRDFKALKLWMSIKTFGLAAIRDAIDKCLDLADYAERRIRESAGVELVSPAQLGVVAFRFVDPGRAGSELDQLNLELIQALMTDGYAFLSSTRLGGRTVLRFCTINPRTTEEDIDQTLAVLNRLWSELIHQPGGVQITST